MSLTQIVSTIGLSAVLFTGTGAKLEHQKKEKTMHTTTSKIEKLFTDTTRHTFVIDENHTITLLLNQFQTHNGLIEKYLQIIDNCSGKEYMIFDRDDYYHVSITDNNDESVVWYDEAKKTENQKLSNDETRETESNESDDTDDDVKDPVPSVREILKRVQSKGAIKSIMTDDGIVYPFDCV